MNRNRMPFPIILTVVSVIAISLGSVFIVGCGNSPDYGVNTVDTKSVTAPPDQNGGRAVLDDEIGAQPDCYLNGTADVTFRNLSESAIFGLYANSVFIAYVAPHGYITRAVTAGRCDLQFRYGPSKIIAMRMITNLERCDQIRFDCDKEPLPEFNR